jgi:DNA helicase IV
MALRDTESARPTALSTEQAYLDMLYNLLDRARERAERALATTNASGAPGGTFQARVERDITAAEQARRLAQLNAVENGLCFGRTDGYPAEPAPADGQRPVPPADDGNESATLYIGRVGLRDAEYEPRLIDWRAPAARPFYAATPKDPEGLVRRRHIYTRNRTVTSVDDEVFDLDRLSEPERQTLSGEAMLIASVTAGRTGRMTDVVATIQAEQDRVIRSSLAPARRSRPCTAPPTCCTRTGIPSSGAASWSSARTPPSSAISARSSRPSARPTWCSAPWRSCSQESRPLPTTMPRPR